MPPIKSHRKSRNGCAQCKRRKIKCDEEAPSCQACRKHRIRCSFDASVTPTPPPPPPQGPQMADAISPSHLMDLELIHNYSTSTCYTLRTSASHLYQNHMVQEAFKHDYLMHSILSLSAFHLASQTPSTSPNLETYLIAAHTHHNRALQMFRQEISNITPENCNALFGCSTFIFLTACARPRDVDVTVLSTSPSTSYASLARVLEFFYLIRGIIAIIEPVFSWVEEGPLAPMLSLEGECDEPELKDAMCNDLKSHLDELLAFVLHNVDSEISGICNDAANLILEQSRLTVSKAGAHIIFVFPAVVSEAFVNLLEHERPEALLLLAYYCAWMHKMDSKWWLQRWPMYVIYVVNAKLEGKWRNWIEWPLSLISVDSKDGCEQLPVREKPKADLI